MFEWIRVLYFLPIFLFGILLIRRISSISRFEQILPAGIILGVTLFIFLLNLVFYLFPGRNGIVISYLIIIFLCPFLFINFKPVPMEKMTSKELFFWVLSLLLWGALIFWKASHALIGGDVRSYYSIAQAFNKGNFPPVTPWQVDVSLSYHTGVFEFLGSMQFLTGLTFEFLHLFFSSIFILCSVQILIWFLGGYKNIYSYFASNVAALIGFISFGFIKIAIPINLNFRNIGSINEWIIWLRNLPSAKESLEIYGISYNLDSLIYVIFQSLGIAVLLCVLLIFLHPIKNSKKTLLTVFMVMASLALINESIFIPLFLSFGLAAFYLSENKKFIVIGFLITALLVVFQGGVIGENIFSKEKIESSVILFPKKADLKDDFHSFHQNAVSTDILPFKEEWKGFGWVSLGIDVLLVLSVLGLIFLKLSNSERKLSTALVLISVFAILIYHFVVPKFILTNSNRILVLAYQLLAINVVLYLIPLMRIGKTIYIGVGLVFVLVIFPSILPTLASMSFTRFGENKLAPKLVELSIVEKWLGDNLSLKDRVIVLDQASPHPSGNANLMIRTGLFAPLFTGGFKNYTVEPGPEYVDVVYNLSPSAIKKLGISIVVIDQYGLGKLSFEKQQELDNPKYFEKIFADNGTKVYRVKENYLTDAPKSSGTFEELRNFAPKNGKYFIDSEKNFDLDFIRRPLIFSLRGRDLYFSPESGVYQHVEVEIKRTDFKEGQEFDFLVLGRKTKPEEICKCQVTLLWSGISNQVYLWKVN